MSKVTPLTGAGPDRLTVKFATVVFALPSVTVTSSIVKLGGALQSLGDAPRLRGAGAATMKSAALSFVSMQPPALRKAEVVALGAGARPLPSKQLAVVP